MNTGPDPVQPAATAPLLGTEAARAEVAEEDLWSCGWRWS